MDVPPRGIFTDLLIREFIQGKDPVSHMLAPSTPDAKISDQFQYPFMSIIEEHLQCSGRNYVTSIEAAKRPQRYWN